VSDPTYRWVDGPTATDEEWDKIEGILASRGWMSLNRPTTRILVADDADGSLLGFICLQMVPHTEPLFVRPSQRGTGLAETLADKMLEFMLSIQARGWMVVADNPIAAELCESRGMVKVESPVYIAR
jgi:hypothetical protein